MGKTVVTAIIAVAIGLLVANRGLVINYMLTGDPKKPLPAPEAPKPQYGWGETRR